MPSKKYNGNSPLGGTRLEGFADVELEVAKRSPKQSLTTGLVQTHNGAIHAPKRRRRTSRGTAATGCVQWKPTLVNTGTTEAPNYKLRLAPGTINGVINSAWNDLVDVTDPVDADGLNYIIATVTFTDKQVTSIDYTVSGTLPDGDELNPITEESLPSSIKIILGTIVGLKPCMVWSTNISINNIEVFQETIANPAANTKPYISWYGYQITSSA